MNTAKKSSDGFFVSMSKNQKGLVSILNDMSMKMFVITFASKQMFDVFLHGFVQVGEKLQLFEQRVQALTGSTEAVRPLYDLVLDLGVGMEGATEAFTRFAVANTTMKRTNDELVQMTETVISLGMVGGGSVQTITAGMQQLGQGLASNRLQGDELRSVLENMPVLAKALADELANGSIAQLRKMGEEGELTGGKVSQAFIDANEKAQELAKSLPDTTERAQARMSASWDLMIEEMLDAIGGTSGMVGLFNKVAEGFQSFTQVIDQNADTFNAAISLMTKMAVSFFAAWAVSRIIGIGVAFVEAAAKAKQAATVLGALAAMTGPGGLLVIGLGAALTAVWALTEAFSNQREVADMLKRRIDEYTTSLKDMEAVELRIERRKLEKAIKEKADEYVRLAEAAERVSRHNPDVGLTLIPKDSMLTSEEFAAKQDEATAAAVRAKRELEALGEQHAAVAGIQREAADEANRYIEKAKEQAEASTAAKDALEEFGDVISELDKDFAALNSHLDKTDSVWALFEAGAIDAARAMELLNIADQRYSDSITGLTEGMRASSEEMARLWKLSESQKSTLLEITPIVEKWASAYGIPSEVIMSQIKLESAFNKNAKAATSSAKGLMQITKGTAEKLARDLGVSVEQIFDDTSTHIRAGILYIAQIAEQEGGNIERALRGYYSGPGDIEGNVHPNDGYIEAIIKNLKAITPAGEGARSALDALNEKLQEGTSDASLLGKALAKTFDGISNQYLADLAALRKEVEANGESAEVLAAAEESLYQDYLSKIQGMAKQSDAYKQYHADRCCRRIPIWHACGARRSATTEDIR